MYVFAFITNILLKRWKHLNVNNTFYFAVDSLAIKDSDTASFYPLDYSGLSV